jgi:hypothetical protein
VVFHGRRPHDTCASHARSPRFSTGCGYLGLSQKRQVDAGLMRFLGIWRYAMSLNQYAQNVRLAEMTRARIRRQGHVAGNRLWSEPEKDILRALAPDYVAIHKKLRHRTSVAIQAQCAKLGLRKTIHLWTGAELSLLRKMYKTATAAEICTAFPHSTWTNIQQAARYHGFRRKSRRYKITGIPALDDVRSRCFEIQWTMVDLDKAARTRSYFRKSRWIGKRINHRALGRAIEALDGVVQAQWNE